MLYELEIASVMARVTVNSYLKKMIRASLEPYAHPYLNRNPRNREVMLGNINTFTERMQQKEFSFSFDPGHDLNTLSSEIKQIFQTAKEEAINNISNIFENAQMKAEASIQRTVSQNNLVNCSHAKQSDISTDLNKMDLTDMGNGFLESQMPDISDHSHEESYIKFESIENSQEAVIRDNLDRFGLYISDCVKATDIIAFFGPLSSAQTKELRCIYKRNPIEASKKALEMIRLMNSEPNRYKLLLEALTDAGYPKIVQILDGTLIPIGNCHRNIIRQCANHIFQRLNTSDILPYLYSKNVISSDDKQQILQTERAESTGIAALELLDMLPNRNTRWFKYFIESLIESGHEDLAKIIKDNTNNANEAFETPRDNITRSSSTGLIITENIKEELDNSTSETSGPIMNPTHGISDISRASDNQSRHSLLDSIASPASCIHASQLDNALDLSDYITDNTAYVNKPETFRKDALFGTCSDSYPMRTIHLGAHRPLFLPPSSILPVPKPAHRPLFSPPNNLHPVPKPPHHPLFSPPNSPHPIPQPAHRPLFSPPNKPVIMEYTFKR